MMNIKIHKTKTKGGRKQEIRSCRKLLREAKRCAEKTARVTWGTQSGTTISNGRSLISDDKLK